jgi:hypothetical protein
MFFSSATTMANKENYSPFSEQFLSAHTMKYLKKGGISQYLSPHLVIISAH